MFIVPVSGDNIETLSGLPLRVLSYTNYRTDGPAVIAEDKSSGITQTIAFDEIAKLNDQKIKIATGKATKLLEIDGYLKREQPLPQPGDTIEAKVDEVVGEYIISSLKLHVRNRLAEGLIIKAEDAEFGDEVELSIGQIEDIDGELFNKKKFAAYYQDYDKKGQA